MHSTLDSSPALKTMATMITRKYKEIAKSEAMRRHCCCRVSYSMERHPAGKATWWEEPRRGSGAKPRLLLKLFTSILTLGEASLLCFVFSILSLTTKLKGASQCQIIAVLERFWLTCKMREPRFFKHIFTKIFFHISIP